MADQIIEELWVTKDRLAKEHGYDLKDMARYLQEKSKARQGDVYQGPSPEERPEQVEQTLQAS